MLSTNTAAFLCANGHIYTEANLQSFLTLRKYVPEKNIRLKYLLPDFKKTIGRQY